MIELARISNTLGKMRDVLKKHNCIAVSVSGGSDSDIIVDMICSNFPEFKPKIHFVFANTGIEYLATLEHLHFLETKYNIKIHEVHGMPIPVAVRKYGVPFISKKFSDSLSRLQHNGFDWEDGTMLGLWKKYPNCKTGIRFWTNDWGQNSQFNIDRIRGLKDFLSYRKPSDVMISAMCCQKSKKDPLIKFQKDISADVYITGERKAEGGVRVSAHTSCFEFDKHQKINHFMPLFYWNDDTKRYYSERKFIVNSRCYTEYGLRRTGCVGCPFAINLWNELDIMKKYEPKLYNACWNVFGEAYKLRKEFEVFRMEAINNG